MSTKRSHAHGIPTSPQKLQSGRKRAMSSQSDQKTRCEDGEEEIQQKEEPKQIQQKPSASRPNEVKGSKTGRKVLDRKLLLCVRVKMWRWQTLPQRHGESFFSLFRSNTNKTSSFVSPPSLFGAADLVPTSTPPAAFHPACTVAMALGLGLEADEYDFTEEHTQHERAQYELLMTWFLQKYLIMLNCDDFLLELHLLSSPVPFPSCPSSDPISHSILNVLPCYNLGVTRLLSLVE
ncbi:hypothetical protein JOM56_004875 [Amanita muscaria]